MTGRSRVKSPRPSLDIRNSDSGDFLHPWDENSSTKTAHLPQLRCSSVVSSAVAAGSYKPPEVSKFLMEHPLLKHENSRGMANELMDSCSVTMPGFDGRDGGSKRQRRGRPWYLGTSEGERSLHGCWDVLG